MIAVSESLIKDPLASTTTVVVGLFLARNFALSTRVYFFFFFFFKEAVGHDTRGISTTAERNVVERGRRHAPCSVFTAGGSLSRLGSSITLAIGRRSLSTCQ